MTRQSNMRSTVPSVQTCTKRDNNLFGLSRHSLVKEDFTWTVPAPLWASPHVSHSISYVTVNVAMRFHAPQQTAGERTPEAYGRA